MPVSYIIDQVCEKLGFDPVDNRILLLKYINRACKEIYEKTDLPGCLKELVVLSTVDNCIALPHYVGELRNMRSHYSMERLVLSELASKYSYTPWANLWNNWRIMKKSPIKRSIENIIAPIILTMEGPCESAVNITVTGQTTTANLISEPAVFAPGETNTQLNNLFIDIFSITKAEVNEQNVVFSSLDQSNVVFELSVLPNNLLRALYTIVDISLLPGVGDAGTPYRYVDVLFKEPLTQLKEDGEEFPCVGYDDAIVAKVCEYKYSEMEDGGALAVGWYNKCNQLITQTIEHTNGASEKQMVFAPNGFLGLYPRYGAYGRGWLSRYSN